MVNLFIIIGIVFFVLLIAVYYLHIKSLHEYINAINAYVDSLKEVLDVQGRQIKCLNESVALNGTQILKMLDLPDEKKDS